MGRPRKSSATLEASGAFRKDPQRARKDHAVPPGRPAIPADLTQAERKYWDQVVGLCEAAKTLTVAEGAVLHQLSTLLAQWHECRQSSIRTGVLDPNTRTGIADSVSFMLRLSTQIERLLNQLGLTPRSRTTVVAAIESESEDPITVWMKNRAGSEN